MSDLSKRIANLPPEKLALLQKRLKQQKEGSGAAPQQQKLIPRNPQEPAPLSFGQERMWFIDQLQPGSPAYNVPAVFPLFGRVNSDILMHCIQQIVHRHEVLRTTFTVRDGRSVQLVSPRMEVSLPIVDLSHLRDHEHDTELERRVAEELQRPFDLGKGPLLRTTLVRLAPRQGQHPSHLLICVMHHIISDAWSISVFQRELGVLYEAFAAEKPSPLPDLPIQYADFALWQREQLKGERLDGLLSFWKKQLEGAPMLLGLPTDKPRPAVSSHRGSVHTFTIAPELYARLRSVSERGQATLFMTTLAAFQALLCFYAATEDVVVGVPIANRSRSEFEGLIGFFLNTLVIRTRLSGNPSFLELLDRVRKGTLDAYAHQDLPFEMLVEALKPERSLSIHPIFQVMFVMQSATPSRAAVQTEQGAMDLSSLPNGTSRFDVTLSLVEGDGHLSGLIEYSTDLFEASTIQRMAGHYLTLLEGICDNPEKPLSQLSILTHREQEQLRHWNQTRTDYAQVGCIHQLLERQTEERPDAVALAFEGRTLTYRELNARANQVAHHLRGLGVGPEAQVGIFAERSIEMMVGVLGVLKAGGAYVPLDPTYPAERLEFMLADTGLSILLTQQQLAGRLPAYSGQVVYLDRDWEEISRQPEQNPRNYVDPDHPAYIIYTSGSSGRPKGVVVPHRGACNAAEVELRMYQMQSSDRILQFSSLNFDASMFEMLMWLRSGATLQLVSSDTIRSSSDLMRLLEDEKVTVLPIPPSMLAQLSPKQLPALRLLLVMGEDCPLELVARWRHVQLFFNAYGPTETTIWVAGAFLRPDHPVTIGRPMANTRIHLLDSHLHQVPIGVPGEIYIGGIGVTRGYLKRPDITAERFLPEPYSDEPGSRMYRTGDLAVYLPDGEIRFLGRSDFQVKIRGFRVELGEIEAVLSHSPHVKEAVVVVRDDLPSGRGLIAYIVPHQTATPSTSELRRFLLEKLPDYMVPASFMVLDALPLNPAGKVDRQALPVPRGERPELDASFVAPTSTVEQVIASIWSTVLGIERIGIHDNFFDLGGHSLLAAQIVSRLRDAFQLAVPIRHIFEFPKVGDLAAVIEKELQVRGGQSELPSRARPSVKQLPPIPSSSSSSSRTGLANVGSEELDALLKSRVDELLAVLSAQEKRDLADRLVRFQERAARKQYPLSFAQERLWFLRQLHPNDISYNVPVVFPLLRVAPALLKQCLDALVQRHEILRTTFQVQAGRPVQVVAPEFKLELPQIDLSQLDESKRLAEFQQLYASEANHHFDLARGPLIRATLVRLDENNYALLLVMDHIITDGWSTGLFYRELGALYEAAMRRTPSPLPELPLQYGEYAQRQREHIQGEVLAQHIEYWRKKLDNIPTRLELPFDHPRTVGMDTTAGALHSFDVPNRTAELLRALGQRERVTPFIVSLAAFQAFLWRYMQHETIVVGSPVTNRTQPGTEHLIGFFVNMLVLRADFSGKQNFRMLLQQVRETVLEAYAHQELPFEKLVEELQPERDPTVNPIFQVMFTLHSTAPATDTASGDPAMATTRTAKFDLSFHLTDDGRTFKGAFEYKPALFNATTIGRMAEHFLRFVEQLVEDVDRPMTDLSLLTPGDRELLRKWNETTAPYPSERCLHELFAEQVAKTPEEVAVIFQEEALTYAELEQRANRVAQHLRKLGIREEDRVGVCLERSIELIVAIIGVLKAGSVYVPLDPEYPEERLLLISEDAKLQVILGSEKTAGRLSRSEARFVRVADCLVGGEPPPEAPRTSVLPDNAAYVIYTSGSTGVPKGAINVHRAVVNRLAWMQAAYGLTSRDRVLQKTSVGFDVSVWELVWPLLTGAALVLAEPGRHRDAKYLVDVIEQYKVTHLHFVPSMLQAFLNEPGVARLPSLRRVICSGEELTLTLQRAFFERMGSCELHNLYGPTEAAIDVTAWKCRNEQVRQSVPIGHPITNTRLYVLDNRMREVPVGICGEIYIGGVAPARGYLERPSLTAERFIPDPLGTQPGARMYRTGDLGRRLPGGEIEFLGRIDHQVKIRGIRIELGEIEATLLQHPGIHETVVTLDEPQGGSRGSGDKRLVAYYVRQTDHVVDKQELRLWLQQKLPPSMVPALYIELEAFPLTSSGKLDRKALPRPHLTREEMKGEFVLPRSPVEAMVAALWSEVLGVDRIGADDNFFQLGGHSLSAVQVLSRIREMLGVDVSVSRFFDAPTPALLAAEMLRLSSSPEALQNSAEMLLQVSGLSDEEVEAMLRSRKMGQAAS